MSRRRRYRAALTSALLLYAFHSPASAGKPHWEFAGWTGGGAYPDVEPDPRVRGRVYLVSDVAGIWRSDDSGEHWNFATRGLDHLSVAFLAAAPSDSNRVYAGTQEGLYRSNDAGGHWRLCSNPDRALRFSRPENHRSIAVWPEDGAALALGTAGGSILSSKDAGASWSPLGGVKNPFRNESPITSLALASDGSALYAASAQGGVAKYSFASRRWTRLSGAPASCTDLFLSAGALYAAGEDALFISEDDGASWSRSASVPSGKITRVSASADASLIAVVWERQWDGGVLLSSDRGRTWTAADDLSPDLAKDPTRAWARSRGARTLSLRFSPSDPRVLFRTDWWGVWRSDDRGATWREKLDGIPNSVGSDLVVAPSGRVYVAAMDDGLLDSSDGGRIYRMLFPTRYSDDEAGHVWRVWVSPDERRIVATSSPWNSKASQVIVSEDGGRTFDKVRSGLPESRPKRNTVWNEGYPRALAVDGRHPEKMYLGIDGDDGGLFISEDGGRHWRLSPGQPGSKRIYNGLALDPSDSRRLYWGACGPDGGVYRTEDGGKSWGRVFERMGCVFDLAAGPDGAVYAAGDRNGGPEVEVSKDRGGTWRVLAHPSLRGAAEALAVNPADPGSVAFSVHRWNNRAGGRIFLTRDGGDSWEDVTGDLPEGTGAAAAAFDAPGTTLYIVRYAGSAWKLDLRTLPPVKKKT